MNYPAYLQTLLQSTPRGWQAWLPAFQLATSDPSQWTEAVGGLSEDDKYRLLNDLREDGGPYADAMLLLLSRNAGVVDNPLVREVLLGDSVDAADRRLSAVEQWRIQLREGVDAAESRASREAGVAVEIARLEKHLTELHLQSIDSEYERVQALESEVTRLETFKSTLVSYDRPAREALRAALEHDTRELDTAKRALEEQIGQLLAEHDIAKQSLTSLEAARGDVEADVEIAQKALSEEEQRGSAATGSLTELNRRVDETRRQFADVLLQQQKLQKRLEEEETQLRQLTGSPLAIDAQDLIARIQELYRRLPEDAAERIFAQRSRRTEEQ